VCLRRRLYRRALGLMLGNLRFRKMNERVYLMPRIAFTAARSASAGVRPLNVASC
jgi:hypothetical protein